MKAIFKAKSYWIISIFATIIIFMAMLNLGQIYKSETDILISSKSEMAEKNISQILENARQISRTLIFYNDILKNNPEIKDNVTDKSNFERKEYWNSKAEAEILKNSGVIRLTILDNDKDQNEKLSQTASSTLAQELSKYYNTNSDIDVKVIDGPIFSLGKKYDNRIIFGISLIIAFSAVFFSYAITGLFTKNNPGRKKETLKFSIQKNYSPSIPQIAVKKKTTGMPTPEEAKKRLNQLLEGRI